VERLSAVVGGSGIVVDSPAFRGVTGLSGEFSTPVEKPVEILGFSGRMARNP